MVGGRDGQRGSSPHTWGIHAWHKNSNRYFRFIPTYVGHTRNICSHKPGDTVHPHIRGAYAPARSTWTRCCGSSPHTWGIRNPPLDQRQNLRFIPTYVGHTRVGQVGHVQVAVHPHLRGAYRSIRLHGNSLLGSSPPTWGIHWTAVRKMAGFSHFSYDFIRKSYFVQGLVFFGVIGAEAFPTHRRGRNQCLPGAHGGSVRNL